MEDTARMVWNQEARGRMSRDVKSTRPGHRPRAAALMTSEVMPRPGSGADRLLPIPLAPHDVSRDDLFPLDDEASRHGRALLGASFIQWLAHDHLARRSHYGQLAEQYAEPSRTAATPTVKAKSSGSCGPAGSPCWTSSPRSARSPTPNAQNSPRASTPACVKHSTRPKTPTSPTPSADGSSSYCGTRSPKA
jgi:hypothetical protein